MNRLQFIADNKKRVLEKEKKPEKTTIDKNGNEVPLDRRALGFNGARVLNIDPNTYYTTSTVAPQGLFQQGPMSAEQLETFAAYMRRQQVEREAYERRGRAEREHEERRRLVRAEEEQRKREQRLKVIKYVTKSIAKYVAFSLGILLLITAFCIIVNLLR